MTHWLTQMVLILRRFLFLHPFIKQELTSNGLHGQIIDRHLISNAVCAQNIHWCKTTSNTMLSNYRRRLWHVITATPNNAPSNLRVLCDHLQLPKGRQVEFKARIIAMTFAVLPATQNVCCTKCTSVWTSWRNIVFSLSFFGPGASRRQLRRRNPKWP